MWSYHSLLATLLIVRGLAAAPTGDSCAACPNGNCLGPETVMKTMLNGPVVVLTVTERLSASSDTDPLVVIASPATITVTPTVTLFASEAVTPAVASSDEYEETSSGAAIPAIVPDPAFAATFDPPNIGQLSGLPTGNDQDAGTATRLVASDNIVGINSTALPTNLDVDSTSTSLAPYRWTNTTSQDRSDGTGIFGGDGLPTESANAISSSMPGRGGSTSFPINAVDTAGASAAPQDGVEPFLLASTASSGFTESNSLTPVSSGPPRSSIIPRPADSASSPGPAQTTNTGLVSTMDDPLNVSDTAASVDTSLPVLSQTSTSSLSTLGESSPTLPGSETFVPSDIASVLQSSPTSSSLVVTTFPERVTTVTRPVDYPTFNSSFTKLAQASSTVPTGLAPTTELNLSNSLSDSIGSPSAVNLLTTLTSLGPNGSGESTYVPKTTTRVTSNVEASDTGFSPTTTSLIGSQGLAPIVPSTTESSSFGVSSMTATTAITSAATSSPAPSSSPSSPLSPISQESRLIFLTTSTEASLPGSPSPSSNEISGNLTSTVPDPSLGDASSTSPNIPISSELTRPASFSSAPSSPAPSDTSSMSDSATKGTTMTLGGSVSSFSTSITGNSSLLDMATVAFSSHTTQTDMSNATFTAIPIPPQMTLSETRASPSAAMTSSSAIADAAATDHSTQTSKPNDSTTTGTGMTPTSSIASTSALLTPTPAANSPSTSIHTTALNTSLKPMNTTAVVSETSPSTTSMTVSSTVSSNSGARSNPASSTVTATVATASVAVSIPASSALTNSNFTLRATVLTGPQTASNSLYATIVTSTSGQLLAFTADGQNTNPDNFYLDGSGRLIQAATGMVAVQALFNSSGRVVWVADSAAASYAAVACGNLGGVLQCTVGGLPAMQYICPVVSPSGKVALRLYTASTVSLLMGSCSPVTVSVTAVG